MRIEDEETVESPGKEFRRRGRMREPLVGS